MSSSCSAARTDLPHPVSPSVSIVHHSREVFEATSCIGTDVRAKNLEATILFIDSPRPLTPYTEGIWSKYYSLTAYPNKPSQP